MEITLYITFTILFVSLYSLVLFALIYMRNKKEIYSDPKPSRLPKISFLIPAYNEQETIEGTLKSVLEIDYPEEKKEIIVLNDGSTDRTREIVEKITKRNKQIRLINKKNSGKADSLNFGIRIAKCELIAVVDADSYPDKNSVMKMIGYLEDENVGAVTCAVLPKTQNNFIERMQGVEYALSATSRKLLEFMNSVYITPGPLSIYKKILLIRLGGFDKENITEDMEITWRLLEKGYYSRMCINAYSLSKTPSAFRGWWRQRVRWNIGSVQTLKKYKHVFPKKKFGMLGIFVMPLVAAFLLFNLINLVVFSYKIGKELLVSAISFVYSLEFIHTPFIRGEYVGFSISSFILSQIFFFLFFIVFARTAIKIVPKKIVKGSLLKIVMYSFVYLAVFPIVLLHSVYKIVFRKIKW